LGKHKIELEKVSAEKAKVLEELSNLKKTDEG